MKSEDKPRPDDRACPACGKKGAGECGRVECDRRRPVTAAPPDGINPNGRVEPFFFWWEE